MTLTQKFPSQRYGLHNLGRESCTTVRYAIKTLASTSDCIIFLFLGIVLIQEEHYFHMEFILATILLCLVFRFLGTFALSALVNLRRVHKIDFSEQIIMGYGGLRGAVGFSLAVVLDKEVWYRELFVSAALAMVFFTVFLQGSTIKLLVKCLNIKLSQDDKDDLICQGWKFMSWSHCQELSQLADLASGWLFTLVQPVRSLDI